MSRIPLRCGAALLGALVASISMPASAEGPTTFQRLTNPEPQNWLLPHRTYNVWRYSELEQITPANIANLKLAFAFPLGSYPGTRPESVPVVDEGFMYVTSPLGVVFKLDVRSGKRASALWSFDPEIERDTINQLVANRGVALSGNKAIINTTAPTGRAIAINRDNGEPLWDRPVGHAFDGFTGQPTPIKDLVLVGQSKGDWEMRGYIAALDVNTGAEKWRFWTVPGPGEPGHETWPPNTDAWKMGGASIWTAPSYDPATNLVYYGTSNASPAYDPEARPGANLYTSSTVALNADTGKLQWYFQYVPGEGLEYDQVTPNHLIDTTVKGQQRKVMAHHATRNGYFYVFDRTSGEFLLGEKNSPSVNWTAGLDPKTGKPLEYDPSKLLQTYAGRQPTRAGFGEPGCQAATSWGGQAYNPTLNRVYSLVTDSCFDRMSNPPTAGYAFGMNGKIYELAARDRPAGANPALEGLKAKLSGAKITAVDVSTGKTVTEVSVREQNPNGNPQGGTMATKTGLVFHGNGDGTLSAYDATTLKTLWELNTGSPLRAPPITYAAGGKQYVAITSGGTGTGVLSQMRDAPMVWVFGL